MNNLYLEKWLYSLYITILFIFFSSSISYNFTQKIIYNIFKIKGIYLRYYILFFHSIIFLLIIRFTINTKEGIENPKVNEKSKVNKKVKSKVNEKSKVNKKVKSNVNEKSKVNEKVKSNVNENLEKTVNTIINKKLNNLIKEHIPDILNPDAMIKTINSTI